jgi:hypothetical protein
MDTLQAGELFPISKVLADPNDSGTYYVQAVIRNVTSNAPLATVNLVDQGGQTFLKNYTVPNVRFIGIKVIVYTDSAYTTPSLNYAVDDRLYYVGFRLTASMFGAANAGGDYTDYEKIKKMMQEVVKEIVEANKVTIPPSKVIDYTDFLKQLSDGMVANKESSDRQLGELKKELTNFEKVFKAIEGLGATLKGLEELRKELGIFRSEAIGSSGKIAMAISDTDKEMVLKHNEVVKFLQKFDPEEL